MKLKQVRGGKYPLGALFATGSMGKDSLSKTGNEYVQGTVANSP